jgi:hypothetical protein
MADYGSIRERRDNAYLEISHELVAQIRLSAGREAHHCDYDLGLGVVRFGNLTVR